VNAAEKAMTVLFTEDTDMFLCPFCGPLQAAPAQFYS